MCATCIQVTCIYFSWLYVYCLCTGDSYVVFLTVYALLVYRWLVCRWLVCSSLDYVYYLFSGDLYIVLLTVCVLLVFRWLVCSYLDCLCIACVQVTCMELSWLYVHCLCTGYLYVVLLTVYVLLAWKMSVWPPLQCSMQACRVYVVLNCFICWNNLGEYIFIHSNITRPGLELSSGMRLDTRNINWTESTSSGGLVQVYVLKDVLLVEFMYLVCPHMPGEEFCRWLRPLLLCSSDIFWVQINSPCLLILSLCISIQMDPWTPGQMALLCRSPLSWSLLLDVLGVVRLLYNHWSVLGVTNVSCVMVCAAAEVRGARRARNTGGWHRWHSQGWVPETPRRHVPEIIAPQQIWKTAHSLMALLVYSLNCAL